MFENIARGCIAELYRPLSESPLTEEKLSFTGETFDCGLQFPTPRRSEGADAVGQGRTVRGFFLEDPGFVEGDYLRWLSNRDGRFGSPVWVRFEAIARRGAEFGFSRTIWVMDGTVDTTRGAGQ